MHWDTRFQDLLQRSLHGELTPDETTELRQRLSDDPEAMQSYLEHCQIEAYLQQPSDAVPLQTVQVPLRASFWKYAALAAVLVGAALVGWLGFENRSINSSIARVMRAEGSGVGVGDRLYPGDAIRADSGIIELAFQDTGVHAIASAPLHFTLVDEMRMILHEGEIRLHVPPQGIGFVVETEEHRITDLGTSFIVSQRPGASRVLVLDGEVAISDTSGASEAAPQHMREGDLANFDSDGTMHLRSRQRSGVLERSAAPTSLSVQSLPGRLYASDKPGRNVANFFLPVVGSGFTDLSSIESLASGPELPFSGVAGSYDQLPRRFGPEGYYATTGWVAWHSGRVTPPQAGRYRFWGYADNHLIAAVDGRPVFDGSRYDSQFRTQLDIPRNDHPVYPCLNAVAGFASGEWFEVSEGQAVQLDILFGELTANQTAGLLLIEREGAEIDETFWGQPQWPLFLTHVPSSEEVAELNKLRTQMERKIMGSFAIDKDVMWQVAE